jgi:hypothetical protein
MMEREVKKMTDLRVGPNEEYKTMGAAAAAAREGDSVYVTAGVYREVVFLPGGVTWQAEGEAILDGGYHPGLMKNNVLPPPKGYLPGAEYAPMVKMAAPNAVFSGFTIRNIAGRGVVITADDCLLRDCRIDHCYSGGIAVAGERGRLVKNVEITGCAVSRCAMNHHDPTATGIGEGVAGAVVFAWATGCSFEGNAVAYNNGEGVNLGKGSSKLRLSNCAVHTNRHLAVYINRAVDCIVEHNLLGHTGDERYQAKPGVNPGGIVISDELQEGTSMNTAHHSARSTVRHNVIVGAGVGIDVRNNNVKNGYDTILDAQTAIHNNTIIAGPFTTFAIRVLENQRGARHGAATISENVFYGAPGRSTAAAPVWRRNGWTGTPDANLRGPGDVYGDLMLAGPQQPLIPLGEWPNPRLLQDLLPYAPLPDSPLVNPDGSYIGAVEPPDEEPPTPPEWAEPLASVEGWAKSAADALALAGDRLAQMGTALAEAQSGSAKLSAALAELRRVLEEGGDEA